jgi:hypothetical protein
MNTLAMPQTVAAKPRVPKVELFEPTTIEETGLNMGFLADLSLKMIYFAGEISANDLCTQACLPFLGILDKILDFLKREELVSIAGSKGLGERAFVYTITEKGIKRAREALERSQYIGPCPVTFQKYCELVLLQGLEQCRITPADVERHLAHLVISPEMKDRIGPAVNSGRSFFLYGPPGNGKTTIASAIPRMLGGTIFVPHAVAIGADVIRVFDTLVHERVAVDDDPNRMTNLYHRNHDSRWVKIKRPIVMVGGELTLETLDLIYDPRSKIYEAPFQMKANGGVFLIDDFGRQLMSPDTLLNRWIVPLESQIDFLTLQNGMKLEMPFRLLLILSTNLNPADLIDEAFLRRLRHKLEIGNPTDREYHEIFRRVCQARGIQYDQQLFVYLLREHYIKTGRVLKSVHPRDLIDQVIDICNYRGVQPHLTKELLDQACGAYFVTFFDHSK